MFFLYNTAQYYPNNMPLRALATCKEPLRTRKNSITVLRILNSMVAEWMNRMYVMRMYARMNATPAQIANRRRAGLTGFNKQQHRVVCNYVCQAGPYVKCSSFSQAKVNTNNWRLWMCEFLCSLWIICCVQCITSLVTPSGTINHQITQNQDV